MRIRKCALKLLGSTIAYFSPPPPQQQQQPCSSPAWDSHAASAAAAGILCQLNRSPWDLIPNEQNVVSQEDEDADTIDGDDIKAERKPLEPPLIKSGVRIKMVEEEDQEKKVKKKVRRKRMEKGIDSTVANKTGETAIPLCKKSDGKGWHCKRPAHLPHSLCQYHLTQLRSYTNNNNSHRKAPDPDQASAGGGDKHRKKRKVDIAGDGNNFYYYYYSGFGPWRGKRRGSIYGSDNFGNVAEEEEGKENSESADGHDAPVTGDNDEEDSEEEDGGEGEEGRSDDDEVEEEEEEKRRRNCRKRGRKPVKARSLKSLL